MAIAQKNALRLLVWNVPPSLAPLMTRIQLSRIEDSATFWRFFPEKQFQPHEVDAIARQLRDLGLKTTVTRGRPPLDNKRQYVIGERKQIRNQQLTKAHHTSDRTRWTSPRLLVAIEDEGRRNRVQQRELEEQERIRALREQRKLSTHEAPGSISLNWHIFPPGSVDEIVRFFSGGVKNNRIRNEGILRERVETFKALDAEAYIRGIDGFNEYIGAKFTDNLIVFENWHYRNALYVLYENWKEISKLSRLDLLRKNNGAFDRIIRRPGWQQKLEKIIRRARADSQ